MKVSEAIDQLKAGDAVWVKGMVDAVYQGWYPGINIREVGWFYENTEISLTEPKNEKVEVPDYIAKLIRKYKAKKETLVCSIANLCRESNEYKWYVDNAEIYERAWVDGYTIKPKRWVVRQSGSEVWYLQGFRNSLGEDIVKQWGIYGDCIKFTDKSKAEAVATLIEGSMEEEK